MCSIYILAVTISLQILFFASSYKSPVPKQADEHLPSLQVFGDAEVASEDTVHILCQGS